MHRTLPYLALFAVVVLLQVFLFDNLSISIYLNPLVYVAFIALLPLDTPPIVLLLSGLATGVTMDLAMGAAGVNTIATLLIAFARPTLLGLLYPRDDIREGGIPSTGRLGNRVFLNYLIVLVLVLCELGSTGFGGGLPSGGYRYYIGEHTVLYLRQSGTRCRAYVLEGEAPPAVPLHHSRGGTYFKVWAASPAEAELEIEQAYQRLPELEQ